MGWKLVHLLSTASHQSSMTIFILHRLIQESATYADMKTEGRKYLSAVPLDNLQNSFLEMSRMFLFSDAIHILKALL